MGIAWLLLKRTFTSRPKRTILFILGYALASAVMITLLSVGQAVLLQARDKDVMGGGDLILLPQGIDLESLKTGGLSALYYNIPQGRFIVRQILRSSRFRDDIETASPYLISELLYMRKLEDRSLNEKVFADGSIPDREMMVKSLNYPWGNNDEDEFWLHPSGGDFYNEMDHFHLPSPALKNPELWAEWHYFNFSSQEFFGYLSIMVAGDILAGDAKWIVTLQISDDTYKRYTSETPATKSQLPLQNLDYAAGNTRVRFENDHYEIQLNLDDGVPVRGTLLYYPDPGLYFPPTILAQSEDFVSGYVIPSIRGQYRGSLIIGGIEYSFEGVPGYHDHNWGIWREVEWNWGHVFTDPGGENPDGGYAVFFGEVFKNKKSKGLFTGVFDSNGFLTMLRPPHLQLLDFHEDEHGIRMPGSLRLAQSRRFTSIELEGLARSQVATPMQNTSRYFIQSNMDYELRLTVDGSTIQTRGRGNAETFQ